MSVGENRYLVIEGVIGAGKTSLARMLSDRLSAQLVLEEVEENPFLADFYQDRQRYAFQTQMHFLFSRYQQQRRTNPDEVSKDIAFHKHTLYQWVYGNRRWAKISDRARSLWSIEYGRNKERPHINMLIEALPAEFDEHKRLEDFFNLTLPLRAKSVLFDSAHIQPVIPTAEMKLLRYVCKETDERNVSVDYDSTDWIL